MINVKVFATFRIGRQKAYERRTVVIGAEDEGAVRSIDGDYDFLRRSGRDPHGREGEQCERNA